MAQDWLENVQEDIWTFTRYPNTRQNAKPAGGAKMGEPKDVAMEALLQAQNLAIQGLKDEIERLRTLVMEAYEEGFDDGCETEAGVGNLSWETSIVRKALDNAP